MKAALEAASEQRGLPISLGECAPARRTSQTDAVIFHLPLVWRLAEKEPATDPVARLLRCPGREVDAAFGDAITSTTHRVMTAIFDGDPEPLYEIILDRISSSVPGCAKRLQCWSCGGDLDRENAARFLRDAFMELRPQANPYVWQGWQSAIAMHGLSETEESWSSGRSIPVSSIRNGSITKLSSGFLNGASSTREHRATHIAENSRCSATLLRSYLVAMGSVRNFWRAEIKNMNTAKLHLPIASPYAIPSKRLAETIDVPGSGISSNIAACGQWQYQP